MEYRKFKKIGENISLLGFGCMRFPVLSDGEIDEELAEKMLDKAYESGVNYFDTAYPYHNGKSELFVGKFLDKYPRNSYLLATKLPIWKLEKEEDVLDIFNEQLTKLRKDYVDFYLLHALSKDKWEKAKELKVLDKLIEQKKLGKIRHLGFSFHDNYDVFEEIITSYDWDFCQIQYNYIDTEVQAGFKGYELAEKLGIPVVIMEPIKGGVLARLPSDIRACFDKVNKEWSDSSWALRFVASHKNVMCILSGMSSMENVEDNLKTFDTLTEFANKEKEAIKEALMAFKLRVKNPCTACRYCMPCPAGVNIPLNFGVWNRASMYDNKAIVSYQIKELKETESMATKCVKCGKCETLCPQHISIRDDLEKVASEFFK